MFLCPRNFPGKNTGMACHFLLQGIFLTQQSNNGKMAYLFIEDRESALISRRYGVPGFFILLLY